MSSMKASDLRNAFEAGRPLVQTWLDIAVQMAALRDDCRTKQIDWQQLKTLLKAQIQDAAEGTDKRVKAILAKADNATAYADLLGINAPEKNISCDATQHVSIAAGTNAPAERPAVPAHPIAGPSPTAQALQASVVLQRSGIDPYQKLDIPAAILAARANGARS